MSRRGSSLDVLCERPVVSRSRIRSHWSSRSFNTYTILRHYIDVRNDFEIGSGQADTERVRQGTSAQQGVRNPTADCVLTGQRPVPGESTIYPYP